MKIKQTNIFDKISYMIRSLAVVMLVTVLPNILFCSCNRNYKKINLLNNLSLNQKDCLTIWAHSDIQPRNTSEYKFYEIAIKDINENFKNINIALVAGDIIHWSKSANVFKWYVRTKNKTSIKFWHEIAGNHDQKDFENYKKYIKMPLHYSVSVGNILILCLSDENLKAETQISDDAFTWWKEMVIKNQDLIIITMTHAYIKESWLFGSIIPSRNINNSDRFANVLKKYKVDIWLCGHTHLPHSFNGSIRIARNLNNTLFLNVSAIRGGTFMDVESFLLFFKKNSNIVMVRSRNHDKKKFNTEHDLQFTLSHEFEWDNSLPIMKKK